MMQKSLSVALMGLKDLKEFFHRKEGLEPNLFFFHWSFVYFKIEELPSVTAGNKKTSRPKSHRT